MELQALAQGIRFTKDIAQDVPAFLIYHNCPITASHCHAVAMEAQCVAQKVGVNLVDAKIAGWLHDISAIIPAQDRVRVAEKWEIEVLPEEAQYPMIIHQKLSAVMARELFKVDDQRILNAIGCHTTLKANASPLDKALFVADKLAWDQPGIAPYHEAIRDALEHSLDKAALVYLQYLWNKRDTLRVIHPWLRDAYIELSQEQN